MFNYTQLSTKTLLITTICLTTLSSNQIQAKTFYKWTDAKGTTHYTQTPPPKNTNVKKISTFKDNTVYVAPPQTPSESSHDTAPNTPSQSSIETQSNDKQQ